MFENYRMKYAIIHKIFKLNYEAGIIIMIDKVYPEKQIINSCSSYSC